jgi:hypothetical protein
VKSGHKDRFILHEIITILESNVESNCETGGMSSRWRRSRAEHKSLAVLPLNSMVKRNSFSESLWRLTTRNSGSIDSRSARSRTARARHDRPGKAMD